MSLTRKKQTNIIYLDDNIIWNPRTERTYILKNSINSNEIEVRLNGEMIRQFSYIDLSSGIGKLKKSNDFKRRLKSFNTTNLVFISPEALGPQINNGKLSPVSLAHNKKGSWSIISVKRLMLTINEDKFSIDYSGNYNHKILHFNARNIITKLLQNIDDITCEISDYPIFIQTKRPDFETILTIYNQFIEYNHSNKLKEQFNYTPALCHIRAHFVTMLLNLYHINTVKVFKFWDDELSWKGVISEHDPWNFHCAVMIIDSNYKEWIWDPWAEYLDPLVGYRTGLLTLKQWLYNPMEPIPDSILITNQAIVAQINGIIDGTHYMRLGSHRKITAIQAIASSALPNPPQRPLSSLKANKSLLFKHPDPRPNQRDNTEVIEETPLCNICTII